MQENNFEGDIRQKMSELRFEPTAPVWLVVEARIREKRRKRRVLLFWFFGLVAAGSFLLLLQRPQADSAANPSTATAKAPVGKLIIERDEQSNIERPAVSEPGKSSTIVKEHRQREPNSHSITTGPKTAVSIRNGPSVPPQKRRFTSTDTEAANGRKASSGGGPAAAGKYSTLTPAGAPKPGKTLPLTKETSEIAGGRPPQPAGSPPGATTPASSKDSNSIAEKPRPDSSITIAPSSAVLPQPRKKASRIEWSLEGFAGQSRIRSTADTKAMDFASLRLASPAAIQFAGAFSGGIGLTAAYPVGKRVSISARIGYSYYSAEGTVSDSVAGTAQTGPGLIATATTPVYWASKALFNWHYATIGAGIGWKPAAKLPLYVHTGFELAAQVASHQWTFRSDSRSFTRNNIPSHAVVIFWSTGFEYQVWQKKSAALCLGPQLRQGLGRSSGSLRLSELGVQARFRF